MAESTSIISQSAEYAIRAVVYLADRFDERMSTQRIAEGTRVPPGYLAKVLQALARAGLVASIPGRTGGFRLGRPPEAISLLEVVNAVEPVRRIEACPLGLRSHRGALCPLHRRLDEAAAFIERAFGETTIAEIVGESSPLRALCESN